MKKRIVLSLAIVAGFLYFSLQQKTESKKLDSSTDGQAINLSGIRPQSVRASAFAVSPKISDLKPAQTENNISRDSVFNKSVRTVSELGILKEDNPNQVHDAEKSFANILGSPMPTPSLSFDGLKNFDNVDAYNLLIIPPDTIGDVGPNHYVQAVNALFRIFDKQGNALTPPLKMSSIFAPLNTPCALRDDGLPNVLYDTLADRWILSQYCYIQPPFSQMVAVSKTGDPTGEYYVYEFKMPNNKINDYSKFGVWTDAYYMSTDEFFGGDYAGNGAFAFDKKKLLSGDPLSSYIYFNLPSNTTVRRGGLLPSDLDGLRPPPNGSPNIFAAYTATEYGDAQDALRLFNFHVDFQNPQTSTFTERAESPLAVAPFDPTSPEGRADISQPSPGEKLDSQSDRLMYRLAYRNLGTSESLVVNQTVRTTPVEAVYQAGVRVYELRKTNNAFSVREQTTLGDQTKSRWIGSAAQDHQGNLAVGYNVSNSEKEPAIFYNGKLATEAIGDFRTETALIEGTGVQKAFGYRWGDYSGMSVDPTDDCTFWLTNQYYTQESEEISDFTWLTRIGKFKFAECTNAPRSTITGTITNSATNQPILNATLTANAAYIRKTNSSGNFGNLFLLPGTYELVASAHGFRSQTIQVTVVDGQTLTQNFSLQPVAVLETSAAPTITAESCAVDNAIDPGETITINVPLKNTGAQNTTNLTVALLAGGGVTNPGAAQNYGSLPTNGASVSRPFTFTADPNLTCGANITLTFQLNDGAENPGTLTIVLRTGKPRVAFKEEFDNKPLPNLPPSWTTSATGGQQLWKTTELRFETPPNSVFSPAPNQIGVNELISPAFQVNSPNAELQFRNWYELETTFLRNRLYDGAVLDIKIGAGNWQDIETAGGAFLSGGYDGVIDTCCQNPLGGRRGWSGKSGNGETSVFITSKAKLPASAAGQSVQLRWRVGTDIGTFREGQYLDNIVVSDEYVCSCQLTVPSRAPFDFDGDGKTDVSIFRPGNDPNNADFYILNSGNNSFTGFSWGNTNDRAANADYDGDRKTDIAVFRPSNSAWYILRSSDFTVQTVSFGLPEDKLTPADYDGDGKADIAVFRPSTGVWYIWQSSNNQVRIQQFGLAEDVPTFADYDGDNKTDIAVFRPSTGVWYVARSLDNGFTALQFGLNGDKPVAGDYDGDGKADFVVYRPSDGNWYQLRSQAGVAIVNFGLSEDKPLQADFDGDGKRDIAVFRSSNAGWYILRSSNNSFVGVQFGLTNDSAVPSIFTLGF